MPKGRHRFVINYASGQSVEVTADKLTVRYNTADGSVMKLEWENMQPRPLMPGLHNIESVWQVH